jgi:hypothetical protein
MKPYRSKARILLSSILLLIPIAAFAGFEV